jgi:hypothetical protein
MCVCLAVYKSNQCVFSLSPEMIFIIVITCLFLAFLISEIKSDDVNRSHYNELKRQMNKGIHHKNNEIMLKEELSN